MMWRSGIYSVSVTLLLLLVLTPARVAAVWQSSEGTISGNSATLRAEPNTQSSALARLSGGTVLTILGQIQGESVTVGGRTSDVWYQVRVGEGAAAQEGYVWSGLVEISGGADAPEPATLVDPTDYVNQGYDLYQAGDYEGAVEAYDRALALAPTFIVVYGVRGLAYYQSGDYRRALDDVLTYTQVTEGEQLLIEALHTEVNDLLPELEAEVPVVDVASIRPLEPAAGDPGQIAFVSDDGLFLVSQDGSEMEQLAQADSSSFSSVTWSLDGRRLAYVYGNAVHTMNRDGSKQCIIPHNPASRLFIWEYDEESPAWSPDGQYIAFVDASHDLKVLRVDTHIVRLLSSDTTRLNDLSWSPDGGQIAFTRGEDIFVWDLERGRSTRLARTADIREENLAWSPDGEQIAFSGWIAGHDEIFVMKADGSDVTQLTQSQGENVSNAQPAWSPDGSQIAFMRAASRSSGNTLYNEIYVMKADGSEMQLLTDVSRNIRDIAWGRSPASNGTAETGEVVSLDNGVHVKDVRRWVAQYSSDTTWMYGDGELEIQNGFDRDAVVTVAMHGDCLLAAIYVKAGQTATINGLPTELMIPAPPVRLISASSLSIPGAYPLGLSAENAAARYTLYVALGADWDATARRFTRNQAFFRFDDPFDFYQKSWTITLQPVEGGEASTTSVDPDDFPDLGE